MTFDEKPTMRVRHDADLIAAVPFILGFHPHQSLVLLAVVDGYLEHGVRVDLESAPAVLVEAAQRSAARLSTKADTHAVLIGYGPDRLVAAGIATAGAALAEHGVAVVVRLRVTDGRYWRLDTDADSTFPPAGVALDGDSNPVTAAAVFAGVVAQPSRAALAATLSGVTGRARERMITATIDACVWLADLLDAQHHAGGNEPGAVTHIEQVLLDDAMRRLDHAGARHRKGRQVSDQDAATLAVLLQLTPIRDAAAVRTSGDRGQLELGSDLVRRSEPAFRNTPAVLLALSALQAGHGALAAIAVDRALADDPHDRLAHLLVQVINAGIDPDTIMKALADDE